MNETFNFGGGPGGGGGRGPRDGSGGPPDAGRATFAPGDRPVFQGGPPGAPRGAGGVQLDPLVAASNPHAPLASKLLAVPALRARYLGYVRELAETWLDWQRLGPIAQQYHALIAADVKRDTRKLDGFDAFVASLETGPRSLKAFADQRREFLLNHPEIKNLPASSAATGRVQ